MLKKALLLGLFITSCLNGMQQGQKRNDTTVINWPALTTEIKDDLYRMLVQEKGVGGINYLEMAHGNPDLANDIKQIYKGNNSCQEA